MASKDQITDLVILEDPKLLVTRRRIYQIQIIKLTHFYKSIFCTEWNLKVLRNDRIENIAPFEIILSNSQLESTSQGIIIKATKYSDINWLVSVSFPSTVNH